MVNDKLVIVLIHGHGVDASVWNDVYAMLASDYTVIKPDFSRLTTHETIEGYAEELDNHLQLMGMDSAVIIGHSMGGYTALAFAEAHPDRVRGLGLFSSTAFADDESKKEARQNAMAVLQRDGSAPFIRETMPKLFGETVRQEQPEIVDQFIATYSQLPAAALLAGVRAIASRPDRSHILRESQFPILVVAGREDAIIPFEKSEQLFGLSDWIKSVVLNKAGHMGMIETPVEAAEAIRSFVQEIA